MGDLIEKLKKLYILNPLTGSDHGWNAAIDHVIILVEDLPSAEPTIYGYNVGHLVLIATVLQKENLPPERVAEALNDIARVVSIVYDEFEETLRKAIEPWKGEGK